MCAEQCPAPLWLAEHCASAGCETLAVVRGCHAAALAVARYYPACLIGWNVGFNADNSAQLIIEALKPSSVQELSQVMVPVLLPAQQALCL